VEGLEKYNFFKCFTYSSLVEDKLHKLVCFRTWQVLDVLTQRANNLKAEIYFGSSRFFQKCQDSVKVPFPKQ